VDLKARAAMIRRETASEIPWSMRRVCIESKVWRMVNAAVSNPPEADKYDDDENGPLMASRAVITVRSFRTVIFKKWRQRIGAKIKEAEYSRQI
jgi:hypothetical protein